MKKKKMGRPQLVDGENKSVLIGARFSPEEAEIVTDAAFRSNESKSEWVRKTLMGAAKKS
jgi:hypothetical protein